jgi:ABC-2 type transport system permease protein
LLSVKQVGGICGALLTNLSAWLSGVWFELKLIGGTFERIAGLLPFVHAVELERALCRGDFALVMEHLWPIVLYGAGAVVLAIFCFLRQMKKQ